MQLSRRDVVAARVSGYIAERIFNGYIFGVAPQNKAEFPFIVGLVILAYLWNNDICAMIKERRGGLEKDEGEGRWTPSSFLDCKRLLTVCSILMNYFNGLRSPSGVLRVGMLTVFRVIQANASNDGHINGSQWAE